MEAGIRRRGERLRTRTAQSAQNEATLSWRSCCSVLQVTNPSFWSMSVVFSFNCYSHCFSCIFILSSLPMSSSAGSRVTGRILRSAGAAAAPRKKRRSLPDTVPSLKEFLHKTKVLKQYRSFLRTIRLIDGVEDRQTAYHQVKREFRMHSLLVDPMARQMAITQGDRKLKQVQSLVGYSFTREEEEDSWLNTKDSEDPRGRVGTEWPWQQ